MCRLTKRYLRVFKQVPDVFKTMSCPHLLILIREMNHLILIMRNRQQGKICAQHVMLTILTHQHQKLKKLLIQHHHQQQLGIGDRALQNMMTVKTLELLASNRLKKTLKLRNRRKSLFSHRKKCSSQLIIFHYFLILIYLLQ